MIVLMSILIILFALLAAVLASIALLDSNPLALAIAVIPAGLAAWGAILTSNLSITKQGQF